MDGASVAPWFSSDPDRLAREAADVQSRFPGWRTWIEGDQAIFEGQYPIQHDGNTIEQYRIRVVVPPDYPVGMPTAFEMDGVLPRDPNRHVGNDGSLCLFIPEERWKYFPVESCSVFGLVQGPIYSFLLNQAYYERTGEWLWAGRGHFVAGRLEYYFEEFETRDPDLVCDILKMMAESAISRQWLCPCGSKKKIRRCHKRILELHGTCITPTVAADARKQILEALEQLRKHTAPVAQERA